MLQRLVRLIAALALAAPWALTLALTFAPARPVAAHDDTPSAGPATTQGDSSDTATPDVPDEKTRLSFSLYGFSVIPPGYWTRLPEERPARAALWGIYDPQSGQLMGLMGIEVSATRTIDVMEIVDNVRRARKLNFEPLREDLDGVEAYEVDLPPRARLGDIHCTRAIVCIRQHLLYYIEIGESGAMSVTPQLRALAKSWKWVPFESISQHLQFRDGPWVMGNLLQMTTPQVLRPPPPELSAKGYPTLIAFDVRHARIEFAVDFKESPLESGEDFPTAARRISQELAYTFSLEHPLTLTPMPSEVHRQVSDYVNGASGPEKSPFLGRWVLVDEASAGVGVFRFMIADGMSPQELAAYQAAVDKMITTIAPKELGSDELPKPAQK